MVLSKSDVRLEGLEPLGLVEEFLLVLGINATFTLCHMAE